ncbi:MAG TPA: S8 family serine peptidase, partial [Bryobacteraceae bacterium]|nr:S8 family serine peptidase [Bryobacteraceae bacterium]
MTRQILSTATLLVLGTSGVFAQTGRGELSNNSSQDTVKVIVRFRPSPDQAGFKRFVARGAQHQGFFSSIRSSVFAVSAKDLDLLASDPDVETMTLDHPLRATAYDGAPDYGWMTALNLPASVGTLALDGSGVGVAVIDSGVSTVSAVNPDLRGNRGSSSRVVYNESFVPGDPSASDAYGHGTHVAGLIAGDGSASSGWQSDYVVRGLAPNVNLINLRVLDANGQGSDSTVIAGIERAIQLKSKYNIRVINLSLGRPVYESYAKDPLCQAVEQAWKAGIVVVVAAGNDGRNNAAGTEGYATINAPGNDPYVITVGAMNTVDTLKRSDDKITSYSSKGPTLFD